MDDSDADYVIDAIEFVAGQGQRFLPLYDFDLATGAWTHREFVERHAPFSIETALSADGCERTARPEAERAALYATYLAEARALAASLGEPGTGRTERLAETFGELGFFTAG
jgi:hypothetical protein